MIKEIIKKLCRSYDELLNKKRGMLVIWLCVAVLFGYAKFFTPVFREGSNEGSYLNLLIGFLLFCSITILLYLLQVYFNVERQDNISKSNFYAGYFLLFIGILFIGSVYLVVFYPGAGMYDTIAILTSQGTKSMNQHPWFYVLFVQRVVEIIFKLGGGYEAALVSLSILQIVMTAAVYSYCLMWLYIKKINKYIWILIAGIYMWCPFLDLMMVNIFKDIPFSLLILMWIPFLYDFWASKGENLKKLSTLVRVCLFILLSLVRNNGVYVSAFLIFMMFVMYPSKWKQYIVLTCMLIAVVAGSHEYEKKNEITHLYKETVGIPLQQIAGVVYYDGKMEEKERRFVEQLIPSSYIKEKFSPYSADKLKWGGAPLDDGFLNANKKEFLRTWMVLLPSNFKIYINVYLKNTYGFWSLDNGENNQLYTSIYTTAWKDWFEKENITIKKKITKSWQESIESFIVPKTRMPGSGIAFWAFIMILIVFGMKEGKKALIVGSPIIGNWITIMISTPVAYQWRYVLCIAMALPLVFGMLFVPTKKEISYNDDLQGCRRPK